MILEYCIKVTCQVVSNANISSFHHFHGLEQPSAGAKVRRFNSAMFF